MRLFQSVTDRAELYTGAIGAAIVCVLISGCRDQRPARVDGVYAHDSRELVRLDCDYNGDGRIDSRTYMRNGRPVRVEADANGDAAVDRWEYYGASGALQRIGASTRRDGVEDTWVRTTGDERVVEISTRRDGIVDRREVYRGETLLRTEALIGDSDAHARPTRRIVYRAGAEPQVEPIEAEAARAAR